MARRIYHASLSQGRWCTLTFEEQMGNIGSDVYRAIHWHQLGDKARWETAFARALELLDLTIADPRWSDRVSTLTHDRAVFISLFNKGDDFMQAADGLQKYFDEFALAARLK